MAGPRSALRQRVGSSDKAVKAEPDNDFRTRLSRDEIRRIKELDISLGDYPISDNETMKYRGGIENYYFHGKSAVNLINSTLSLLYRDKKTIKSILDFPCGHGRVLRGLKANFEDSVVYACDLDKRGVDFCSSTLGAVGVYSNMNLDKVKLDAAFDLIWAGSLLTHMDSADWSKSFDFFERVLNVQGILIVTYAGSFVKDMVARGDHEFIDAAEAKKALLDYARTGVGFMQYNNVQHKYGRTICTPAWVRRFLDNHSNYRTVLHYERGWGGRQDVVALVKEV